MAISICSLLCRAVLSLLNIFIFAVFVATQYFQDTNDQFFFKWILGNYSTSYISSHYTVSLSLSWWTKYFWYGVYFWQLLWMLYAVAILFKRNFPNALSCVFFLLYILSSGLDIAWVVFISRNMIIPGCVVIFLGAFLKGLALALAYVNFAKYYDFEKQSLWDFWGFHVLVFNGIAGIIVIGTYNALIWLSIVLTYDDDILEKSSTTVSLMISFTMIIIWFILESTVILWSTRFTFSIYPVLMVTVISSLLQNWDPKSRNFIMLSVLLGVTALFFVCHVIRVIARLAKARRTFPANCRQASVPSFNIEFMTTRF